MPQAAHKQDARIEVSASLYGGQVTITRDDTHAYYWVERGYYIPGVTSILGILDKPALMPWAAKMTAEYVIANMPEGADKATIERVALEAKGAHTRKKEAGGAIGTVVHKFAEHLFKGKPAEMPTDEQAIKGITALQAWIKANDVRPIDVELVTLSREAFFAGTMDLLASVNGRLTLVDLKTSSGIWPEFKLQTAAYRFAWMEEYGEHIEQIVIVNTDKKTGKPKILEITDEREMQFYADTFLRCKALHDNYKQIGRFG